MTTLLLTFFILMFTTAEIEGRDLQLILSAFKGSLGMFTGGMTLSEGILAELGQQVESLPAKEKGDQLAKAVEKAVSIFQPEVKSRKVKISFYESGSAELTSEGLDVINKMGNFLSADDFSANDIRVEGHTDDSPVTPQSPFPSNWELSAARAVTVVRIFNEKHGISGKALEAIGLGEYQPVETNDIEEGRAYNRRIEIVIMRKKEFSL
jgi:chemotaxis protein MotB